MGGLVWSVLECSGGKEDGMEIDGRWDGLGWIGMGWEIRIRWVGDGNKEMEEGMDGVQDVDE